MSFYLPMYMILMLFVYLCIKRLVSYVTIFQVTNMPFHVMNRRQTHSMETRNIHLQTLQSFQDRRYELQTRIQRVENFMGREGDNNFFYETIPNHAEEVCSHSQWPLSSWWIWMTLISIKHILTFTQVIKNGEGGVCLHP